MIMVNDVIHKMIYDLEKKQDELNKKWIKRKGL
ncbi:hypothetical protein HNR31_001896 [Anoxybacillus caldiproteolyticus]|uniref:Uncharacterized protein n=1 Tax=Thermaerobacillus caldiproteolyticus TaxID=247480 RepID=A0A7W0BYL9_9BACL|nr:hypothetical protein [Anoxybacillus caldiproteolyticus]